MRPHGAGKRRRGVRSDCAGQRWDLTTAQGRGSSNTRRRAHRMPETDTPPAPTAFEDERGTLLKFAFGSGPASSRSLHALSLSPTIRP